METYLDILPQEIIGEIIEYINDVDELNALKSISNYISQAVNKYIHKFVWHVQSWATIKEVLVSFNSFNKLSIYFKIYVKNKGILVFEKGRYSLLNNEYHESSSIPHIMKEDIERDVYQLEYIDVIKINMLLKRHGFNRLRPINKEFINFCLEADFKNQRLNDLIKKVISARLISRTTALQILENNFKNFRLLRAGNHMLKKYFGKYIVFPLKSWTDISIGLLGPLFEITETNFDDFDMPLWDNNNLKHLSEQYDQLEQLLEESKIKK